MVAKYEVHFGSPDLTSEQQSTKSVHIIRDENLQVTFHMLLKCLQATKPLLRKASFLFISLKKKMFISMLITIKVLFYCFQLFFVKWYVYCCLANCHVSFHKTGIYLSYPTPYFSHPNPF